MKILNLIFCWTFCVALSWQGAVAQQSVHRLSDQPILQGSSTSQVIPQSTPGTISNLQPNVFSFADHPHLVIPEAPNWPVAPQAFDSGFAPPSIVEPPVQRMMASNESQTQDSFPKVEVTGFFHLDCLLYTSPSPRDRG